MEQTYKKSWPKNLLMLDMTLDPSFSVKQQCPNLKVPVVCLLLVLEVLAILIVLF